MADEPGSAKGPGLEGQTSGEGRLRTADAAVSDQELPATKDATGPTALDQKTFTTLVAVTRAMYPHDRIPDVHYERVVEALDTKAAEDEGTRDLLAAGVRSLATLTGRWPEEFGTLPEEEQVRALRRIEDGAFFKAVSSEVVVGLYSQHDIWPYFGYEGPSNDKGGYVDRGFDDIDWLEDAPDRRGNGVEKTFVDPVEQVTTEQRLSRED